MLIRPFDPSETESVVALWEAAGLTRPWNDPRQDIARKLRVQPELFLVGVEPGQHDSAGSDDSADRSDRADTLLATAMAGYDGHRGWVYYVAVEPSRQGERLGAELMTEVERLLVELGCPKVNIQVRQGNDRVIGFYEHHGYTPDGALGFGKRLISD